MLDFLNENMAKVCVADRLSRGFGDVVCEGRTRAGVCFLQLPFANAAQPRVSRRELPVDDYPFLIVLLLPGVS
jgi:hypothetical protein